MRFCCRDACCKLASFISLFCHEGDAKIFIYYFYLYKTSAGFKASNFFFLIMLKFGGQIQNLYEHVKQERTAFLRRSG